MAMYVTFEGHVLSENAARDIFHKEAALSDLWVYSEGFPESQLETVRNLPFAESAQLRTSLTGSAPDYDGAQVDICLEDEDVLDHPVCLEGELFDPTDKEGVWLSQTFADLRGIKVGDTICWHLYDKNDWYEAKVGVIYRSSESQGITMLRRDFDRLDLEFEPTTLLADKDLTPYEGEDYVSAVISRDEMITAYMRSMEIVNLLVYMMIGFAVIMLIVVLYNSGSLSFNERLKEFATLKVLGYQSSRIRGMLRQQNIWFSVIGIIIGAPLGQLTLNSMMNSNGENFDYNLILRWQVYVLAAAFVLVTSCLISFMFARRIRRLDMVEVLKGVE